jgi:NADH-quinone oxidoreductase subunit G
VVSPAKQVAELSALVAAATDTAPLAGVTVEQHHRDFVAGLKSAERKAIWLGQLAVRHPAYASLRALAQQLAAATGASFGVLAEGANAAGAHLAGVLPHRAAGGAAPSAVGLNTRQMLEKPLQGYVLLGVEPGADTLQANALASVAASSYVVALTPYASEELKTVAHVLLPVGTFAETSGTFVNLEGEWQSFPGAAQPVGESRPAWKVLRVLGNLLGLAGFEQLTSEDVRGELRSAVDSAQPVSPAAGAVASVDASARVVDVPIYRVDGLVRRAASLQNTRDGGRQTAEYGAAQGAV